jgi:hypothetical protein
MGYACPVCGDPQADGHHLANHLAFTAMLGDADHEAWLDERVPEWADADPADLAAAVTEVAEKTDYPQVFEDTTGEPADGHDHRDHADDPARVHDGVPVDVDPPGSADDAVEVDVDDVLAEARELTRRRRADAAGGDGDGTDDRTGQRADGETDGSQ